KLRSNSIASIVRDQLEQDILSGKITGGEHISEMLLAKSLTISRGPVREAFRTLEGQGLLEQRKNYGWFVRLLSTSEIQEIFVLRKILDNGLASLLISRINNTEQSSHLLPFDSLIDKMDKAIIDQDRPTFSLLNQKFHDDLIKLSGNERFRKTYRHIMGELASHVAESLKDKGAMQRSNEDHKNILKSLKEKDLEKLQTILKKHSQRTENRMDTASKS
ncbi:MAG: FCD domain-containing protein, partial [Ostreibacterium sp.]